MSYEAVIADCHRQLEKLGRARENLKILAVSKLQPVQKIKDLYDMGHRDFAENYVQEALQKQEDLGGLPLHWHFIGSLQRNKVKLVVGKFDLIHSVDSIELAREISKNAQRLNLTQKILIQVNLAQEITKGGFSAESLRAIWKELCALSGIAITGLMTMPPLTEDPEDVRQYFQQLSSLQVELAKEASEKHSLRELSMGTSHDYHVAIAEGATIVRLGTILFGERPSKN